MPDESEVIQAEWFVEFPLPNGKVLRGKPVPFQAARKIMAAFAAFDRVADYDQILVPALDLFSTVSGISDDAIAAACPDLTLGELTSAITGFFFRRRPILANGAATPKTPDSTKARPGEPGA